MNTALKTLCLALNPKLERGKIFPIFIPFAGCPHHCIFCAQESQTGKGKQSAANAIGEAKLSFPEFLAKTKSQKKLSAKSPVADMAFYGGTFTAISDSDFSLCLDFFKDCKELARQHGIELLGRCSTRPDALHRERLEKLQTAGIDLIELGIQSFDNTILAQSSRAYTKEAALTACKTVLESGFKLGIQLMAGLPAQDEAIFLNDAETAISLKPHCMRYYPCLVPAGTALAKLFLEKKYTPWTNGQCIQTLGYALALAWQAQIPVIRLTVAPEQEFDTHLVAGPRHPALGSDIMGRAMYTILKTTLAKLEQPARQILIPAKYQGCFFGTKNWLKKEYAELVPLERLIFDKKQSEQIRIVY